MDHAALKDYILADPVFADHVTSGWDAAIADIINARSVRVVGVLTRQRLIQWVTANGHRRLIEQNAANFDSPLCDLALTLRDIVGGALETIDLSDASNIALLDAWLGGTIADEAARATARAELIALASTDQPVFGQAVHHLEIAKALRG